MFVRPIVLSHESDWMQGGMLETVVLVLSGITGTLLHIRTVLGMSDPAAIGHEMFHVMTHAFMLMGGFLSLVFHCFPRVINVVFPVYVIFSSFQLSLHSQSSDQSTKVHYIYSVVLALFGIARLATLYDSRLALLTCWLGIWSSIVLQLSALGGIEAEIELNISPSDVAGISGMLSSAICACVMVIALARQGMLQKRLGCGLYRKYKTIEEVHDVADGNVMTVGKSHCSNGDPV